MALSEIPGPNFSLNLMTRQRKQLPRQLLPHQTVFSLLQCLQVTNLLGSRLCAVPTVMGGKNFILERKFIMPPFLFA